jgi:hypothetical protein
VAKQVADGELGRRLLNHTSSAKERGIPTNHTNHLHLQGYSPNLRTIYYGGELKTVTVKARN